MSVAAGGGVSVALRCARSERRCSGSLRVLVAGRAVAQARFALRAPGGVAHLEPIHGTIRPARAGAATVRVAYRNAAGAARSLVRRVLTS
jgi:hypothetical protein